MPELPEVETIVRGLRRNVLGKKLRRFFIFDTKRITTPRPDLPVKIIAIRRSGKYIIFETDRSGYCVIHLRMTGSLLINSQQTRKEPQKHKRAAFYFSDNTIIDFIDVRRFGTLNWLRAAGSLPRLGVEPFSVGFNPKKLSELFKGKKKAVKSALLDQGLVAGIGNIYADEALWRTKINPKRKAGSLNRSEANGLVDAIKNILREAIKNGGSTLRDYKRVDGSAGGFQDLHRVYGREGEKCSRCGGKIKRIKVGGRSSFFCPKCQK